MNKRWTKEEVQVLVQNYHLSDEKLSLLLRYSFPNSLCKFNPESVKKKRQRLNIKKQRGKR